LALLKENGLFRPTLSDLHELKLHQKQGIHWWTTLANFVGNTFMMFIFCVATVYLAVRFHRFRQTQKAQAILAEDENL
jgi:Na+/H+ antiporter NhaD/arsenite permease-like protein